MRIACFFLPLFGIACERKRTPALNGVPVILADADGRVRTASEEAARCGIRPGQKVSGARALYADLAVLPYDRPCYEEEARPARDLVAVESSVVEPESPELCFVEMDGREIGPRCRALAGDLAALTGVGVWAGLADSKIVARTAAEVQGPERVLAIHRGREASFLASARLDRVVEIPAPLRDSLLRLNLKTLGDVATVAPNEMLRRFRQAGMRLRRLAHGQDGEPVRALWPPRTIEHGVEMEEEIADEATLEHLLHVCADRIAAVLAVDRSYCRALTLRVTMADETGVREDAEKLTAPVNSADGVYRGAMRIFRRMRVDRPFLAVRLIASDVGMASGVQLTLLDDNDWGGGFPHERARRIDTALTQARRRFGEDAVRLAGALCQSPRIGLWTDPLGHRLNEQVEVDTDGDGAPVRYWWRGDLRQVARVQNRWRETAWSWGRMVEEAIFRVETLPPGLSELRRSEREWRLSAVAD